MQIMVIRLFIADHAKICELRIDYWPIIKCTNKHTNSI